MRDDGAVFLFALLLGIMTTIFVICGIGGMAGRHQKYKAQDEISAQNPGVRVQVFECEELDEYPNIVCSARIWDKDGLTSKIVLHQGPIKN